MTAIVFRRLHVVTRQALFCCWPGGWMLGGGWA